MKSLLYKWIFFLLFSLDLFCLVVLRPLYQVILLTKLTASTGSWRRIFTKYYVSACLSGVQPGTQLYCSLEMETMQEEADTDTGPDILSSAEYANLESEGIALLTRQLQVIRNINSLD